MDEGHHPHQTWVNHNQSNPDLGISTRNEEEDLLACFNDDALLSSVLDDEVNLDLFNAAIGNK